MAARIMNVLTTAILAFTMLYLQDVFSEILSVAARVQFGALGLMLLAVHMAMWRSSEREARGAARLGNGT